jgi:hypothetical protein
MKRQITEISNTAATMLSSREFSPALSLHKEAIARMREAALLEEKPAQNIVLEGNESHKTAMRGTV